MKLDIETQRANLLGALGRLGISTDNMTVAMIELDKLCQAVAENALPEGCQAVKGLPPLPEGECYEAQSCATRNSDDATVFDVVATKSKPAGLETGAECPCTQSDGGL